jgi:hypothetical protein
MTNPVRRQSEVDREEKARHIQERVAKVLTLIQPDANAAASPSPETRPYCENCGGDGYLRYNVPVTHPLYNEKIICDKCETGQRVLRLRWEKMFELASTPVAYQGYNIQDWRNLNPKQSEGKRLAIGAAWLFISEHDHRVSLHKAYGVWKASTTLPETVRSWLVLQGTYGLGKTSLALTISNELNARGKLCLFIRVADFIERVQRLYNKDVQKELKTDSSAVIDQARRAPVLILDDFNIDGVGDSEKASNNRRSIMEQVIRYRYNNAVPTIITLNDTQDAFKSAWGERIVSPILDAAHWIPMGGPKLRDERPPIDIF